MMRQATGSRPAVGQLECAREPELETKILRCRYTACRIGKECALPSTACEPSYLHSGPATSEHKVTRASAGDATAKWVCKQLANAKEGKL
jgi:hypothetical protein